MKLLIPTFTSFILTSFASTAIAAFSLGTQTCSISNVTADGANANYCINVLGGSPKSPINNNDAGGENFSAEINALFNTRHETSFSYSWWQTSKDQGNLGTSGTWDFSVQAPLSKPFMIVLKSGRDNSLGAYFFNFASTGSGTFDTTGITSSGKIRDISHISLYEISAIPEPAMALLLGPAVFSLMVLKMSHRKKV